MAVESMKNLTLTVAHRHRFDLYTLVIPDYFLLNN